MFELFVAVRYLKAKRKQAVISVITVIAVLGVAAGVMAMIVALAVTNGFRGTLQRSLLGATAHVMILEKEPGEGIREWTGLESRLRALPGVRSVTPNLYGYVLFSGAQGQGGVLKGIRTDDFLRRELLAHIREGSLEGLDAGPPVPGVVLGSKLARAVGARVGDVLTVVSPQGELTPFGPRPSYYRFRVCGLFETGFYDLDSSWAFTSLPSAQRVFATGPVINSIELKIDDIYAAADLAARVGTMVGPKLAASHWMEQNRQLLNALKLDRVVTVITIGLIQLVAALNILITLIMMVMEKQRDIAILVSMGARIEQIRRIFILQGMLIGAAGTAVGLAAGYLLCHLAHRYRWIRLDEEVYSLSFVPFDARWVDGTWVAGVALLISFLATLYPARHAARIVPVEALRYE